METPDPFLERVASVLAAVPGVVAIALGCGDELRNWGIPIRAQIRFNADFWRVSGGLRRASGRSMGAAERVCAWGTEGQTRAAHGQPPVLECALVDGPLRRSLAGFAGAVGRLRDGQAALLSMD